MTQSTRAALNDLGMLLHLPGLLGIPAVVVALIAREHDVLPGFLIMITLSLGVGQFLHRAFDTDEEPRDPIAQAIVAGAWLLIACLAALPLYAVPFTMTSLSATTAAFADPVNAFFEAMSGLTSTGLTMATDPSTLPHTLQWWRSSLEWIGGIGMVFLIAFLLDPAEDAYALAASELNLDPLEERTSTTKDTFRWIWITYSLYTLMAILAFWIGGMPFWEALNHGLTGVATGGFSVTSDSFQSYSALLQGIALFVIVLGAISFTHHCLLLRQGRWRWMFTEAQMITLWVLLLGGFGVLLLINRVIEGDWLVLDTAFQWTSALGTCGFNSVSLSGWGQAALFVLVIGMFIGGAAGSTAGGLKLRRVTLLVKSVVWRTRALDGRIDQTRHFNGEALEEQEASRRVSTASVLLVLFLAALVGGTLLLMLLLGPGYPLASVFFEVASALGSVGLSAGVTSPDLSAAPKLVLITLMWIGRLEIIAVVVLFAEGLRSVH